VSKTKTGWLYTSEYGQQLKQSTAQQRQAKNGNPPGFASKAKGKALPPTMCGFGYTGKTTQLKNEKIIPQKKSERQ
jgi:hypothetical protein